MDMPNDWIQRTFEPILSTPAPQLQLFPIWLILGSRQIGKSSLLRRLCLKDRQYINLDDLEIRRRANEDPEYFIQQYQGPLLIDEIQYAPQLLSPLKRRADENPNQAGLIWLTGSQNFKVMEGVKESLAGRVAILNLSGLSDEEKLMPQLLSAQYFEHLLESGFPKLFGVKDQHTRDLYLSSYVQTYIERDIRELLRIEKRREFEIFVKVCALRTGQVINYDDMARDTGVAPSTVKEWLRLLEDSFLIRLVTPYFTNRTKRLTKAPKLYFLDAGLAAYLSGWKESESARLGPMGGALFETHILSNILKYFRHRAREVNVSFWRTRDGDEIDFLLEYAGKVRPIEVKMGTPRQKELLTLDKIREEHWLGGVVISLAANQLENFMPNWKMGHPYFLPEILHCDKLTKRT